MIDKSNMKSLTLVLVSLDAINTHAKALGIVSSFISLAFSLSSLQQGKSSFKHDITELSK